MLHHRSKGPVLDHINYLLCVFLLLILDSRVALREAISTSSFSVVKPSSACFFDVDFCFFLFLLFFGFSGGEAAFCCCWYGSSPSGVISGCLR